MMGWVGDVGWAGWTVMTVCMLVFWAVVIFLPIVLGYTVWCYANMWGRVTADEIETRAHSAY